jgi:hypothetical protein
MKKGNLGLILAIIICYAIYATAIAVAIIGAIALLVWGISCLVKAYKRNQKHKIAKEEFYNSLIQQYQIANIDESEKLDVKLSNALYQSFFSKRLPSKNLIESFEKMITAIDSTFRNSTIWSYKGESSIFESQNNFDREIAKFSTRTLLQLDKFCETSNCVCIKSKHAEIYLFPSLCIIVSDNGYSTAEWDDLYIEDTEATYVEESTFASIHGATPAYYNYLHKRVGGGPDRRYKDNPSTPVYRYGTMCIKVGDKEFKFMIADEDSVSPLITEIETYKQIYCTEKPKEIKTIDCSHDEYASAIKSIIEQRGKSIVKDKIFVSILADYRIFRQKPYLRTLLKTMTSNGYWDDLLIEGSNIKDVETVKLHLRDTNNYSEQELEEAMAYIAYGLNIRA